MRVGARGHGRGKGSRSGTSFVYSLGTGSLCFHKWMRSRRCQSYGRTLGDKPATKFDCVAGRISMQTPGTEWESFLESALEIQRHSLDSVCVVSSARR